MVDNLAISLSKIKLQTEPEIKQQLATKLLRTNLDKNGLTDWHIRISKAVKI